MSERQEPDRRRREPAPGEPQRESLAQPPTGEPQVPSCPLCQAELLAVHCRLVCPRCGYSEDCTDIFRV
jgi:hypothetical protein